MFLLEAEEYLPGGMAPQILELWPQSKGSVCRSCYRWQDYGKCWESRSVLKRHYWWLLYLLALFHRGVVLLLRLTRGLALFLAEEQTLPEAV